jgi:hypothetical protein
LLLTVQDIQSTVDGVNPTVAELEGLGGVPVNADWRHNIQLLAGLGSQATGANDSVFTASSPHMRVTLLRYRVGKKLLLWDMLLSIIPVLVEEAL